MSVFKIEKTKDFTVMCNFHLRDKKLTYKAKGLLSFMLSLPEDWDYSLAGLTAISKESRDGIRSILKELQDNHYLEIEKVRGEKGYFEYNYLIYEKPHFLINEFENNNPGMENPHLDEPDMEIPTQINTNIINTKEQIDKGDKTKSSFFIAEENFQAIFQKKEIEVELPELTYDSTLLNEDGQISTIDCIFSTGK